MTCGNGGTTNFVYTGNQVGDFNFTGDFNFVAGGPPGSGLSAGITVGVFTPNTLSRRPWEASNAVLGDALLDAAYPTINLQWFADIFLDDNTIFRVSDRSFYVQDTDGLNRYYDARVERAPTINVTVGEWLNPNYEVSNVMLTLNNRDGFFNDYLPHGNLFRQWSDAKIIIKVGFSEKLSNYYTVFEGQVTVKDGLSTTRDSIEIRAYDKLDLDEIPLPPNSFSTDTFPDIGEDGAGKGVPLVYGNWSEDVPEWGAVNATCTNAADLEADFYEFKVSDVELESLDSVWLHRGQRKEELPDGPVEFDFDALIVDLSQGKFSVPVGTDVFTTETVLLDNQSAGLGSGLDLIAAKDDTVSFVAQRIQVGDRIIKRKTGEIAIVSIVTVTNLTLTGGVTFAQDDEYVILTKKYKFIKGDKVSVVCKGKPLNLVSVTRLQDIDTSILQPTCVAVGFDSTYWICDNATQKIYNLSFKNAEIIKSIDYADVHPSITQLSGVSIASDGFLWTVDPVTSTIYRYNHVDGGLGLSFTTDSVTGISALLANVTGIVAKTDNKIWIVDQDSATFYEIDVFSAVNPFVVTTFDNTAFDALATNTVDIGFDEQTSEVVCVDAATLKFYRLDETDGSLNSSFLLSAVSSDLTLPTGCCIAQDGTVFFSDLGSLAIYNYNDLSFASSNPCFIARDLLQKFGGHTYDEFDLSWNQTARQMFDYSCRVVVKDKTNVISLINTILKQFNVTFHLRFQKYALFWITFENFRTNGRLVKEKDIKVDTFKPGKEVNQYFNSITATYDKRDFQGKSLQADTYVSPAGIAFAGREINKKIDMSNVYKRSDLDRLLPLFVKLAVPEPEFVDVTFGFRVLRTQMQDFLTVNFDGEPNMITGKKESGRRFNDVPCMVRRLQYELSTMAVTMKLWSLGSTSFPGWTPPGRTVGGDDDIIVLTNLGRLGRISPVGIITADTLNTVTLEDFDGQDAETRSSMDAGLAWTTNYKVALIDGATKAVLQTLTIASVVGQVVTFVEDIDVAVVNTIRNVAGFITGGVYLQYANYDELTNGQRLIYGSYAKPVSNYPSSRTQELEEQRAGVHSFDDGGIPYVLYPTGFVSYG